MTTATHPGIRAYEAVQAMDFDADGPCFGRDREAKQASIHDQLAQLKAEFILMALKNNASESETAEVGRCLLDNCTRESLFKIVRAVLKGEQLNASLVAHELIDAAADYYAELEV